MRIQLMAALCISLLISACSQAPQNPQANTAPEAQQANAPTAPETYGVANFAGIFSGTLPCADCPGIDTTLTLKNDGSYSLHSAYQERDANFDENGFWEVEQSDHSIRLQPENKNNQAQAYQIISKDEIKMLDAEGKRIDSPLNYSLHRNPA